MCRSSRYNTSSLPQAHSLITDSFKNGAHPTAKSGNKTKVRNGAVESGFHFNAESAGQKHCQFTAAAASTGNLYRDKPLGVGVVPLPLDLLSLTR